MKRTSLNEKVLETSLTLLFNIRGRWKDVDLDKAAEKVMTKQEKESLLAKLSVLEVSLWGCTPAEATKMLVKEFDHPLEYVLAANNMAKIVHEIFGYNVLQALIPTDAMNANVRKSLKRKGCETLAAACDDRFSGTKFQKTSHAPIYNNPMSF